MTFSNKDIYHGNSPLVQKIQTLIISRLLAIFVILVASWIWSSGLPSLSIETFPQGLLVVFLISVGLTIVYFFLLRLDQHYHWQVRSQFLLDSILITWLIWQTGDLTSPYLTLYIVLIGVASIFLKPRETLFFAVVCVFLFVLLSILSAAAYIDSFGQTPGTPKTIQIIGVHAIAFLVVGLLASRLSERQTSSEELKKTARTLADLRALHERIVASIRSGLITADLDGNIFTFNLAAEEITGFTADEMLGKSIYSLFGNIHVPINSSLDAAAKEEYNLRFETDIITPEEYPRRIGYGISPLFSEAGVKKGLIMTFQDLTDIRTMEENVRRKDRLAAVGRVAAGLAHEIRNPLGAMRGAIQVLESKTPPDSAQGNLMEIILRESDRLNKIITNFLTYARPRVSNFSKFDIREAIDDTFMLLQHSPEIKDFHKLRTELPDRPVNVTADPTQLKQIFWNLSRNAIQAMSAGGELCVTLKELENNRIRILFEDTGCGMSPQQVERLFEPFSNSTTGGTGLGLSIVYQIVRDHSGTINVRSLESAGTTITLELPKTSTYQNVIPNSPAGVSDDKLTKLEEFLTVDNEETKNTP